jgi:hypothetical protein
MRRRQGATYEARLRQRIPAAAIGRVALADQADGAEQPSAGSAVKAGGNTARNPATRPRPWRQP